MINLSKEVFDFPVSIKFWEARETPDIWDSTGSQGELRMRHEISSEKVQLLKAQDMKGNKL